MAQFTSSIIIFLSLALAGCAGSNFTRQDDSSFRLGQTTYQQVVAKMGPPKKTEETTRNNESITKVTYSYGNLVGEGDREGIRPVKVQLFFFNKDVLVAEGFLSSFKADSTFFDESKLSSITRGKTTRDQVISILGRQSLNSVPPFAKGNNNGIGYQYMAMRGGIELVTRLVQGPLRFHMKSLNISFDENNVVTDIEFDRSGEDK